MTSPFKPLPTRMSAFQTVSERTRFVLFLDDHMLNGSWFTLSVSYNYSLTTLTPTPLDLPLWLHTLVTSLTCSSRVSFKQCFLCSSSPASHSTESWQENNREWGKREIRIEEEGTLNDWNTHKLKAWGLVSTLRWQFTPSSLMLLWKKHLFHKKLSIKPSHR